jgi:hypothetical protein
MTTIRYSIEGPSKIIAAVMPFSEQFDDVYFVGMAHAATSVGAACKRVDKEEFEGDIVQKIKQDIKDSITVIADHSGVKPNVLYEVGFSHGIGKPTIHICSTPLEKLAFDVKTWNTIPYGKGRTFALKEKLAHRLKEVLSAKKGYCSSLARSIFGINVDVPVLTRMTSIFANIHSSIYVIYMAEREK